MEMIAKTEPKFMSEIKDDNIIHHYVIEIVEESYKVRNKILEKMVRDGRLEDKKQVLDIMLSSACSYFGSTVCNVVVKSIEPDKHNQFIEEIMESVKEDIKKIIKMNIDEENER